MEQDTDDNKKIEISEEDRNLMKLRAAILNSESFSKLFRCTQMVDEAVRTGNSEVTNRGVHSIQVANVATQLAEMIGLDVTSVLRAQVTGLAHDLGHTPMGHATEKVFTSKIREKQSENGIKTDCVYEHGKYGAIIFDEIIEDINKRRKSFFGKDYVQLTTVTKSELIYGIQNHTTYYANKRKSHEEPEILAAILADTIATIPSDVHDMLMTPDATQPDKMILDMDTIKNLVEKGRVTYGDKDEQGVPVTPLGEDETTANMVEDVLKTLMGPNGVGEIQTQICREVAEHYNSTKSYPFGKLETICDELKEFREIAMKCRRSGKELNDDTKEALEKLTHELRSVTPTLAIMYEIQDELVYNQVIKNTEVLGNNETENAALISAIFDKYYDEFDNLSDEEKEKIGQKAQNMNKYILANFDWKDNLALVYAIAAVQEMSNDDIDKIRNVIEPDKLKRLVELHTELENDSSKSSKTQIEYKELLDEVIPSVKEIEKIKKESVVTRRDHVTAEQRIVTGSKEEYLEATRDESNYINSKTMVPRSKLKNGKIRRYQISYDLKMDLNEWKTAIENERAEDIANVAKQTKEVSDLEKSPNKENKESSEPARGEEPKDTTPKGETPNNDDGRN